MIPNQSIHLIHKPSQIQPQVSGDPEPRVEWWREGELVTTAREDPTSHRILLPDSGLFFLRAEQGRREGDSGTYWCRAENRAGAVTSRRAALRVSCKRLGASYLAPEMEKAYKIARGQFGAWKISTQNMCKKCSKPFRSEQKCQKLHTKRQTTLKNAWQKKRTCKKN